MKKIFLSILGALVIFTSADFSSLIASAAASNEYATIYEDSTNGYIADPYKDGNRVRFTFQKTVKSVQHTKYTDGYYSTVSDSKYVVHKAKSTITGFAYNCPGYYITRLYSDAYATKFIGYIKVYVGTDVINPSGCSDVKTPNNYMGGAGQKIQPVYPDATAEDSELQKKTVSSIPNTNYVPPTTSTPPSIDGCGNTRPEISGGNVNWTPELEESVKYRGLYPVHTVISEMTTVFFYKDCDTNKYYTKVFNNDDRDYEYEITDTLASCHLHAGNVQDAAKSAFNLDIAQNQVVGLDDSGCEIKFGTITDDDPNNVPYVCPEGTYQVDGANGSFTCEEPGGELQSLHVTCKAGDDCLSLFGSDTNDLQSLLEADSPTTENPGEGGTVPPGEPGEDWNVMQCREFFKNGEFPSECDAVLTCFFGVDWEGQYEYCNDLAHDPVQGNADIYCLVNPGPWCDDMGTELPGDGPPPDDTCSCEALGEMGYLCCIFECPGWQDYLGYITDTVNMAIGDITTPEVEPLESVATPTDPIKPQVDKKQLEPPKGKEAEGLGDASFDANDLKSGEEINFRDDPGGFNITNPLNQLDGTAKEAPMPELEGLKQPQPTAGNADSGQAEKPSYGGSATAPTTGGAAKQPELDESANVPTYTPPPIETVPKEKDERKVNVIGP
ncbi:hypothetical protein [Lysinibacillus sp. 54212]|uniref:hypothetical protein n=1 Tax=Lysinibacillus sp. 54212 TaxID=3119829 RepID=UPI002FC6539F